MELGVGNLIALVLGLGGSWVGQPPAFPHCPFPGELCSTAPASSFSVGDSKGQGQLSCSHTLEYGSHAFTPPGPAVLFCSSKGQGLISELLYLVRGGASSP